MVVPNGQALNTPKLCPAQTEAFAWLVRDFPVGSTFVLWGGTGAGKTEVLSQVKVATGATLLTMRDFLHAMRERHPLALEETFEQMVMEALAITEAVIVDDLHLLRNVVGGCGFGYPRPNFLNAPLTAITAFAAEARKKIIFGSDGEAPEPVRQRCCYVGIKDFKVPDYAFLCQAFLDAESASQIDYEKIFRFAPKLNAHQLKTACLWLKQTGEVATDRLVDYLRSQQMASNVDLAEVQEAEFRDLKGVDEVLESLEANIILPLENDALAAELTLKPKRGVLLAGPPGTGKTTVGRALAHRLRSKFFSG